MAREVRAAFESVPYIVDVNDGFGEPRPRLRIAIDQDSLEYFRVQQSDVYDTIGALIGGTTVGYSHRGEGRNPIEIADVTEAFRGSGFGIFAITAPSAAFMPGSSWSQ